MKARNSYPKISKRRILSEKAKIYVKMTTRSYTKLRLCLILIRWSQLRACKHLQIGLRSGSPRSNTGNSSCISLLWLSRRDSGSPSTRLRPTSYSRYMPRREPFTTSTSMPTESQASSRHSYEDILINIKADSIIVLQLFISLFKLNRIR